MINANDRWGLLLAFIGPALLGLAIAMSRYAYQGGTNGITIATGRALFMVLALTLICHLTGRRLQLPLYDRLHCTGMGFLLVMMAYGNVGSVQFISVGLAALLFYTFPPMVAGLHALILRERLPLIKVAAIAIAFLGLMLMLGVSLQDSDWRGIVLALGAAISTAWHAIWLARKLPARDPLVITWHMAIVAAIVMLVFSLVTDSVQLPTAAIGWFGLLSVTLLQASGMPLYFAAITRIGAMKTAMISNIQPVVSIVAAFLLFAELLSLAQFFGGGLVLFGIWLMQWYDNRAATINT